MNPRWMPAWTPDWIADLYRWTKDAQQRMDTIGVRLYSAAIAYRTIFSLVAFMSTLVLIATMFGLNAEAAVSGGGDVVGVPPDIEEVARERVARTLDLGTTSVVTAGVIGLVLGLYGMAGGFAAICDVLDRVHGTQRYVRLTARYLRGVGIAAVFVVLATVAFTFAWLSTSTGEYVLGLMGLSTVAGAWSFLVLVVVPILAMLSAYGFVLRYGSHARPPWSHVVVGAVVATTTTVLLAVGFVVAVQAFGAWQTYGVFATAVILLLFGYMQAYVVILVAMFATELAYVASLAPITRRFFAQPEVHDV